MTTAARAPIAARDIHITGIVQGVGFRPHVFRIARAHHLSGWVRNGHDGVRIHVEGDAEAIDAFIADVVGCPPPAAVIAAVDVTPGTAHRLDAFEIRHSESGVLPTTRIAPDLPVCDACLAELFDPQDRRYGYPYINCTNCGPRFSIVRALPYDRVNTTMAEWPMCEACAREYHSAEDRRFHAQPVACAACGPAFHLVSAERGSHGAVDPVPATARLLREGRIVAIKGIGGYHLACDAANAPAVRALRERKYRKEQPFGLMVRDLATADSLVMLTDAARAALTSPARPIVLAPARLPMHGVAPVSHELGIMLPYAPLHHLLFASGAPSCLVMTSGNKSSEPIAYADGDALTRLDGIADAWLIGNRAIARRVDDSVVRVGRRGAVVLRRSRGLAPAVVATLPSDGPVLAVGGDLKNAVTLVVDSQACVSQHVGDLRHLAAREAFETTVRDLLGVYGLNIEEVVLVHDAHPEYASTQWAQGVACRGVVAVQHHRAHVASVLAERGALGQRVVGVAFDGTGYGDDGTIWGGEFFVGSVAAGFERVAHIRTASLPGGDAAAAHPVQAAAGFLSEVRDLGDLTLPPFSFPGRYRLACAMVRNQVRSFATTSVGRLFDAVAAIVGFARPITFEGQAAMWLEHLARAADTELELPFPLVGSVLDWGPTLTAAVKARRAGADAAPIARAFHRALADATAAAIRNLCARFDVETVVLSGGVMQNQLLLDDIDAALAGSGIQIWSNQQVPPSDGGLSLGQAALAVRSTSPVGIGL